MIGEREKPQAVKSFDLNRRMQRNFKTQIRKRKVFNGCYLGIKQWRD